MKRVIIVHGWGGCPESDWMPWLTGELRARGFHVDVPKMPFTNAPFIKLWVSRLKKIIGSDTRDLILVGHSVGTQTIQRYLSDNDVSVKGTVLVGAWYTLQGLSGRLEKFFANPWINRSINFEKVVERSGKNIVILSDDDYFVPFEENKKLFQENLRAKIIVEHSKGHLSGDDGVTQLPSILEAVLEIAYIKA